MIRPDADTNYHPTMPDPETQPVEAFKDYLVSVHNQFLPQLGLTDFDANKNYMGVGDKNDMYGAGIRYPRREDKQELLELAWHKATECSQQGNRALLLAAAVVAIHPFNDGNGRVSRATYTDTLGVERVDVPGAERTDDINRSARQLIDLGTAFAEDDLLDQLTDRYAYVTAGIPQQLFRVGIHDMSQPDDISKIASTPAILAGMSPEEQVDYSDAVGADEYGNSYRKDGYGLAFAFQAVVHQNPELAAFVKDRGSYSFVNVHEIMPQMSAADKSSLVSSLWQYRKLRAQAAIDFLADDAGYVNIHQKGRVALRDVVIEATSN